VKTKPPLYALSGRLVGPRLAAERVVLGTSPDDLLSAIIENYDSAQTARERLAARAVFLAEIATGEQARRLGKAVRSGAFRYEDCTDDQLGILLSHRSMENRNAYVSAIRVQLVFVAGLEPQHGLRADTSILDPATAMKALVSLQALSVSLLRLERIDAPSRVRGPGSRR
jgi:hypothetical protein